MLTGSATTQITIDPRYSGLPGLAHGGYVGGLVAGALGSRGAEVRLRRPIRTSASLTLADAGEGRAELREGETVLAKGASTDFTLDVPRPPSLEQAAAASERFLGLAEHPYPDCYVCGTGREVGAGLRLFPGPLRGRPLVAAPWVPPLGADGASVPVEQIWAAFDCAQLWALLMHQPGERGERAVSGTLAGGLRRPVLAGEPHVVFAWPLGRDGDSLFAGAALVNGAGEICASGLQTAVVAQWGVPLDVHRPSRSPL